MYAIPSYSFSVIPILNPLYNQLNLDRMSLSHCIIMAYVLVGAFKFHYCLLWCYVCAGHVQTVQARVRDRVNVRENE